MMLDQSVMREIRTERSTKANPAMYYSPATNTLSVESRLSPHEGQLLVCDMDYAGNPFEDTNLTEADVIALATEMIRERQGR